MGLDIITSVSKKTWHASYSGLHLIRKLALMECGADQAVADCLTRHEVIPASRETMGDLFWALQVCGNRYPNLMLHSDCEGSYSRRGKVNLDSRSLDSGSSTGLLKELSMLGERIDKKHKYGVAWDLYIALHCLVKDEVENGKGRIEFA